MLSLDAGRWLVIMLKMIIQWIGASVMNTRKKVVYANTEYCFHWMMA